MIFLNKIQNELSDLNINIRKALCGRSMVINFGEKTLYTRSLMIADLSKEESLKLQEEGVGDKKLYGCGIFFHISLLTLSIISEKTRNLPTSF